MPTPSSSATSYASASDMLVRYDDRTVRDLCSDTGSRTSSGSIATNTRLLAALLGASGLIEAAVTAAATYKPEDLQALTGASLAYLKDLVCALALGRLFLARPDIEGKLPESYKQAMEELSRLRAGEWAFGLLEQRQAGLMDVQTESASDVENRRGIVVTAQRLFARRNNRRGL